MSKRKGVPRAGFIPYYIKDSEIYVMLMKPSDPRFGGDEFQIAKGHVDPGEDSVTAAMREAMEELGLLAHNIVSIKYLGKYLGYTDIYYGQIKNKNDFITPMYETGETAWMTINKFFEIGRPIHKPIFNELLNQFL